LVLVSFSVQTKQLIFKEYIEWKVERLSMSLKVEDVMVKDVVTVSSDKSAKDAADMMNRYEIGCLLVVNRGKAVGILTERDLLKRVISESRSPRTTKVKEIMSKPLIVVEAETELEDAAKLMFKMKIKKLPIVKQGKLTGLVTLTDLARFQPQMIRILKQLSQREHAPKRMQKVLDYYIA
jgi:CBS domain-containing protein